MKASIERPVVATKPRLPALFSNKTTGWVYLIRLKPLPENYSTLTPYESTLLSDNDEDRVVLGHSRDLNDLNDFEPFTGRLILENDK